MSIIIYPINEEVIVTDEGTEVVPNCQESTISTTNQSEPKNIPLVEIKLWARMVVDPAQRFTNVAEMLVWMLMQDDMKMKLEDKKTNKVLFWEEVASKMAAMGVKFPDFPPPTTAGSKCREKYFSMQKTYIKKMRTQITTGKKRKLSGYFQMFDQMRIDKCAKFVKRTIDDTINTGIIQQPVLPTPPWVNTITYDMTGGNKRATFNDQLLDFLVLKEEATAARFQAHQEIKMKQIELIERDIEQNRELIEILKKLKK